jgi:hypothetical protein
MNYVCFLAPFLQDFTIFVIVQFISIEKFPSFFASSIPHAMCGKTTNAQSGYSIHL